MDDEADSSAAERAFEALRAEVAALRQAVTGQTAPDYALTLGAIVKELQAVGARLAAIEAHPALAMTPEGYAARLSAAEERGRQAGSKELWDARGQLDTTTHRLEALVGVARARVEQRQWIGVALACGFMLGVGLVYILPSVLPWGAGDWLTASLIGGGPWRAGETLMERASPATFGRMVRLYNACGQRSVVACEAALTARGAGAPGRAAPTRHPGGKASSGN